MSKWYDIYEKRTPKNRPFLVLEIIYSYITQTPCQVDVHIVQEIEGQFYILDGKHREVYDLYEASYWSELGKEFPLDPLIHFVMES